MLFSKRPSSPHCPGNVGLSASHSSDARWQSCSITTTQTTSQHYYYRRHDHRTQAVHSTHHRGYAFHSSDHQSQSIHCSDHRRQSFPSTNDRIKSIPSSDHERQSLYCSHDRRRQSSHISDDQRRSLPSPDHRRRVCPFTHPARRRWSPLVSTRFSLVSLLLVFLVILSAAAPSLASCRNRRPRVRWREDGRCGPSFPLGRSARGPPSQCDPNSDRPCCSDYGYCGNSASHCNCHACVDFRKIIQDSVCYFSLNGDTGFLESPGYPKPYMVSRDCCYDIRRPDEGVCGISLTVEGLDLGLVAPNNGGCATDYLSLPSCAPETGTRICGNNTGQVYEYLYQPKAQSIRFVFHTDDIRAGHKGFRIKYEQLRSCPGPYQTQEPPISPIPGTGGSPCYTRINDLKGSINTPYFPKFYPNNLDCVYEFIRAGDEFCGVRMQSVHFEMAPALNTIFGGACTDFLHLPSCGFLCGNLDFSWIVEFQPGARSLKFHFHSDEEKGYNGFRVTFEQITRC